MSNYIGVDGARLTDKFLKPFQRAEDAGGCMYIVLMEEDGTLKLIDSTGYGYLEAASVGTTSSDDFRIVKVYERPSLIYSLKPEEVGKCIWEQSYDLNAFSLFNLIFKIKEREAQIQKLSEKL